MYAIAGSDVAPKKLAAQHGGRQSIEDSPCFLALLVKAALLLHRYALPLNTKGEA